MRLAIVSLMGGLPWGGSEALWHALASHSLAKGDKVFVSIYNWGNLPEKVKELEAKGAVVHTRKRHNANAGLSERIARFVKNRKPSLNIDYRSVIDFKPDAVFISQGDSFDLAVHHRPLYSLLKQHHISYSLVCHSHLQYSFLPSREVYPDAVDIFCGATTVYFVSMRQWKLTERRLATKLANGDITWNPVNIEFPSSPLFCPDQETACFAMVANLTGAKGHDTAFEVFAGSQWKSRKWRLNVYGSGEGLAYLQDLARFYGISEHVIFHGHTKDIAAIWQQNHLLLIPSAGEGLPISLVEAMACGRAAVVTDVGGNTEVVTNGQTGFVAVSPTTEAFAAAMEQAWQEKGRWVQLGKHAFTVIGQKLERKPEEKIYRQIAGSL